MVGNKKVLYNRFETFTIEFSSELDNSDYWTAETQISPCDKSVYILSYFCLEKKPSI